jgi:hypothetical protein
MTPLLLLALCAGEPPKGPLDKYGRPDFQAAMNDRLAKGVTPDTNANVLLWKALGPTPEGGSGMPAEFFERLGMPEPPKNGDYFVSIHEVARSRWKMDGPATWKQYDVLISLGRRPWKAAEFPKLAEWLAANEKPLALIGEAARRPKYFNPIVTKKSDTEHVPLHSALLPTLGRCRELGVTFSARAMLRLGEGKTDEAWHDLQTAHRLGRHVARGGSIEGLVGGVVDQVASNGTLAFVAHAGLTVEQLRARMKEFQELPPMPSVADQLDLSSRYVHLDMIELVRRDGGLARIDEMLTVEERRALDWSRAVASGNRWYDRMVAAMRKPTRAERHAAFAPIGTELDALLDKKPGKAAELLGVKPSGKEIVDFHGNLLVALDISLIQKSADAADRAEQVNRNVVVAFALAAYDRSEGRYPVTLDVLSPRFVAAVPGDVFSGRGLVYRRTEAGYTLHSVGPDGKGADPLRIEMPPK